MSKRSADGPGEGEPPQKAPGVTGNSGARAETVSNPIPRLFKTQTLTFHFTQRTWEEVGPGELLYLPSCSSPVWLFDAPARAILSKYVDSASIYQINEIKNRVSNILMLQDEIQVQGGTPKEVSAYTQACYLIHYNPKRIQNWFKLGITDDCGKTQKMLKVNLKFDPQCSQVSQFIKVGVEKENMYTNFEHLTINPAKPYIMGGYDEDKVTLTKPPSEEEEGKWDQKYTLEQNYFSPNPANPMRVFSCNYQGTDPHIPINTHPTMARNLDSWKLYKYGEEFTLPVRTNLEGLPLINTGLNAFTQEFEKINPIAPMEKTTQYMASTQMIYPSRNRPYFTRKDNLSHITPLECKNNSGRLQHHFITMPPIKKNDGSLIKQRASFLFEQSVSVTMQFPEYTSDPGSIQNMIGQSNGVLLRPGIFDIQPYVDPSGKSPIEPPPMKEIWDPKRDAERESIATRCKRFFTARDYKQEIINTDMLGKIALYAKTIFKDASEFASFCKKFQTLCDLLPRTDDVLPPERSGPYQDPKWVEKYGFKVYYDPMTDDELANMVADKNKVITRYGFGFLFNSFLHMQSATYKFTEERRANSNIITVRISDSWESDTVHNYLAKRLQEIAEPTVAAALDEQCRDDWVKFYFNDKPMNFWQKGNNGKGEEYWEASAEYYMHTLINKYEISQKTDHFYFSINSWIKHLQYNNIFPVPLNNTIMDRWAILINNKIDEVIEEELPRIKIKVPATDVQRAAKIMPVDYNTELFFV